MTNYVTKKEAAQKRAWFRALSGVFDFFASIASFIIIVLCVALITMLFEWVKNDVPKTFESLGTVIESAIVQPDQMD